METTQYPDVLSARGKKMPNLRENVLNTSILNRSSSTDVVKKYHKMLLDVVAMDNEEKTHLFDG